MIEQLDINDNFFSQSPCLYLKDQQSFTYAFSVGTMPPEIYEAIINEGFRRSGIYFYQNLCPACRACIPIRVDVQRFTPSKSQRRVLRKNREVRVFRHRVAFEPEGFSLYQKYCARRHDSVEKKEDYTRFLIESPVPTEMMRYYVGDQLMGIGWIDVLPNALSSVYFAFDPDYSSRSPGVFSMLKELELCKKLGKRWHQIGFWIKENRKMSYKTKYKPFHLLTGGVWREWGAGLTDGE